MKVKLAAQTLSNSVASALEYLEQDLSHPLFKGAGATVQFVKIFNYLFAVFNSRNLLSKGKKAPIKEDNIISITDFLKQTITFTLKV